MIQTILSEFIILGIVSLITLKSFVCCKFLKCLSSVDRKRTFSRASIEYFFSSLLAISKLSTTGLWAARKTSSIFVTSGCLSCSSSVTNDAFRSRQNSISASGPGEGRSALSWSSIDCNTWFCQFETVVSSSSTMSGFSASTDASSRGNCRIAFSQGLYKTLNNLTLEGSRVSVNDSKR